MDRSGLDSVSCAGSDRSTETSRIRACTNCVRAKAKCSTAVDGEGRCQRCHSMKKICQPSPPVRRNRTIKKTLHRETSKLEAKLDDLFTLLKSNAQAVPMMISPQITSIPAVSSKPAFVEHIDIRSSTSESGGNDTSSTFSRNEIPLESFSPKPHINLSFEVSEQDAELFLDRFRSDFVKNLPFISIPPPMTAYQLRQKRPLLWMAIMTVASNNSTQQKSLSKEARCIFAKEAFVEGTKNMDLLLAVLVYTVWDRIFYSESSVLINLIQLSIAMLYNLGLDMPPSQDPAVMLAYDLKGTEKPARLSRVPTNEERRALLGYFLLSSVSCYTLRKGSPLRWTAYSDECLRTLETENEIVSDALLAQLVRLRLITMRINDLPWSGGLGIDSVVTAPLPFYLKSLESQLQNFKKQIPRDLENNETLRLELHTTECSIYEIGLSQIPNLFHGHENQRIEYLWLCTTATNSFIDTFLAIPPAEYIGFSALTYSNMTHCFLSAYRLTSFQHGEWNQSLCMEYLDVPKFLDQAEKNFASVKKDAGLVVGEENMDSFSEMASRIRLIKILLDKAHGVKDTRSAEADEVDHHGAYDFSMDLLDGDWLKNLLDMRDEQL